MVWRGAARHNRSQNKDGGLDWFGSRAARSRASRRSPPCSSPDFLVARVVTMEDKQGRHAATRKQSSSGQR
jgi:hypothetical protein